MGVNKILWWLLDVKNVGFLGGKDIHNNKVSDSTWETMAHLVYV